MQRLLESSLTIIDEFEISLNWSAEEAEKTLVDYVAAQWLERTNEFSCQKKEIECRIKGSLMPIPNSPRPDF